MRIIAAAVIALAALAALTAHAQSSLRDAPIRWESKIIRTGDSTGKVLSITQRPPDERGTLENVFGGAVGERWTYHEFKGQNPRSVYVEFEDGRVVRLWSELHR